MPDDPVEQSSTPHVAARSAPPAAPPTKAPGKKAAKKQATKPSTAVPPVPVRSRPTRVLPTARIAFDNQLNILRGYAAASGVSMKPVTNDEVAKIISTITSSTVSLANAFFVDVGLLVRSDQACTPSEAVSAFARAWEWSPATAAQKLAPVLQRTWFAEKLFPMLRFRTLPEEEAIRELGGAANAGTEWRKEIKTLIDYLEAADLVKRENGHLRLVGTATMSSAEAPPSPQTESLPEPRDLGHSRPAVATSFAQPTQGMINFHVDVRVDMAEFSGWPADRISAFFGGIAQVLAAKSALEKGASA